MVRKITGTPVFAPRVLSFLALILILEINFANPASGLFRVEVETAPELGCNDF
jgi:hypothetical protein